MRFRTICLSLLIVAAALLLAACAGTPGPAGPAGPAGAAGPAGPAGPPGPAGAAAVTVATFQPELCTTCHKGTAANHQVGYDELYQDGVIKVTELAYAFQAPGTHVVTFKMTKAGAPFNANNADSLAIYFAPYDGKAFQFDPVAERLSLKGKIACDATGKCTSTLVGAAENKALQVNYATKAGLVVLYGRDEDVGRLPARIYLNKYPFVALIKTGAGVNFVSLANDAGCVKCHSDPYLKHGYIYAQVNKDPATDFLTCKACHLDNGKGGHYEWQLLVDNPDLAAAFFKDAKALTEDKAKQYEYKTSLMNDVHMSHAMEFPYPQSMSNCATCHAGKLDKLLADENFTIETCKSCHAMTGAKKTVGETVQYDTTKLALKTIVTPAIHSSMDLNKVDCTSCHKKGGTAKQFSAIHNGYDPMVYAAANQKYSDAVVVTIDSAAVANNKLTFKFSAAEKPDLADVDVAKITPTVLVGLYGWNTKDYIVGPHERAFDDNGDKVIDSKDGRNLEFVVGTPHARMTTVSAAGGKWEVTADLTPWAALIKDGTVKRLEIGVLPSLKDKAGVVLALNAPSKTFDLATNKFVNFYSPITDVKKCNDCHDALATNFHSASYGGNITVCRLCHVTKSAGSHLELQSRSIDSYVHAIHSSQQFDIGDIDFNDVVAKMNYDHEVDFPYPKHGVTNCESCHFKGMYDVPSQSKSLPGLLSALDTSKTLTRKIKDIPSYVTGPATRACGGCHRAALLNEDAAGDLVVLTEHFKQGGYLIEAGKEPAATLDSTIKKIMDLFK